MGDLLLTRVRPNGASTTDVAIVDGRVASIGAGTGTWTGPVVDGGDRLLLAGLVDGHAHLDKTMWGLPWRAHAARPGLAGLIAHEHEGRRSLPAVAERAAALLETYVANGTSLVRTHVDVDPELGLSSVEGVLEAASRFADRIDVEVVAFPQSGLLVAPPTAELLEAAIRTGATAVGGLDPGGFDGDAVAHLDTIFAIADRTGCVVDVHLHDRGTLGRWELGLVIERTRALGMEGRVTVSHAFCLCDGSPDVDPLLEQLADARVALATVAPGNVEPLPLRRIVELGVGICLGQDGVRDLWSPWGDADMLARAGLMAWRAGARRDDDIELALDVASTRGARALGVADHGVHVGSNGDLVLVDAETLAEATVVHPPRALVVKRGVVVAGALAGAAPTTA